MKEKTINTVSKSDVSGLDSLNSVNGSIIIRSEFSKDQSIDDNSNVVELHSATTDEIELLEERKRKNGVEGIEGELLINQNIRPIFQVDVDGSILVSDEQAETKYDINEQGELIFNF